MDKEGRRFKTHSSRATNILFFLLSLFFFFCFFSFYQLVNTYYWYWVGPLMTDTIVDIDHNFLDKNNEGRIVHCKGEITVEETLTDPLYNVHIKGVKLYRRVQPSQKISSNKNYIIPIEYRANENNYKLGVFSLRNLNENSELIATHRIRLTEENIPSFLKNRSILKDGKLYITESDNTISIVTFWATCAEPQLHGNFLGRQNGEKLDIMYFSTGVGIQPKEIFYYLRGPIRPIIDIVMRLSYAFLAALTSAFFCLFFFNKTFTKLKLNKTSLFILALLLTLLVFTYEFMHVLSAGVTRQGFNLMKASYYYSYCEIASAICIFLTFSTFLYIIIRKTKKPDITL